MAGMGQEASDARVLAPRASESAAGHARAGHPRHEVHGKLYETAGKRRKAHGKRHHKRAHRKHRRHRHPVHHKIALGSASVALPTAPATPPAPSSAPVPALGAPLTLPARSGCCGARASGRRPGEAQALAGQPLQQVVYGLTRPSGEAVLSGPAPVDEERRSRWIPIDAWGDDHCWWLDRMVRSDQQLVERMTFIWHDWFANSNAQVDSQQLMLDQNKLFRAMALGSFHDLFLAVTADPAMLVFLDGIDNEQGRSPTRTTRAR